MPLGSEPGPLGRDDVQLSDVQRSRSPRPTTIEERDRDRSIDEGLYTEPSLQRGRDVQLRAPS